MTAGQLVLHPPLDLSLALTSSFCEYRPGRFHPGIDLSTSGEVGHPVRAVADGRVERVRASNSGYGRAIYLRISDGRLVVYGHLHTFEPELAKIVRGAQESQQSYTVDLQLGTDGPVFRSGDRLGTSGRAGTVVPHLHLEIRDASGQPLDPLAEGIVLSDNVAPRVHGVTLVPHGVGSLVNGRPWATPVDLESDGAGGLRSSRPILLTGRAHIEVDASDRDDSGRGRVAVSGVDVNVGQEEVVTLSFDGYSWSQAGQARHVYGGDGGEPGSRTGLRLDVPPGGETETLRAGWPDGWLDAARDPRNVLVTVRDRAGNRTSARFETEAGVPTGSSGHSVSAIEVKPAGEWMAVRLRGSQVPPSVTFHVGSVSDGQVVELVQSSGDSWVGWFEPQVGGWVRAVTLGDTLDVPVEAGSISARTGGVVHGAATLQFPEGSLFRDAVIGVRPDKADSSFADAQGLVMDADAFRIGPDGLAIRRPVMLAARGPDAVSAGVFRLDESRRDPRWVYVGGDWDKDRKAWVTSITGPGLYAVARDDEGPVIGELRVIGGPLSGGTLLVPIDDRGSGVDATSVDVHLDEQWMVAAWDGPRKRVEVRLPEPLLPGPHVVDVVAVDRTGNRSRRALALDPAGRQP